MNLTLFFRLIAMSIFQNENKDYNDTIFFCPTVYAKDGFNISLQIHFGNYAGTENGYRSLGHTYKEVEFGFPSEDDPILHQYSEMYDEELIPPEEFTAVDTVGSIPISVLEKLFEKRGGIDWEKTISVEQYERLVNKIGRNTY